LLGISVNEEKTRPDVRYVAEPFVATNPGPPGEYWNNPWVKHQT